MGFFDVRFENKSSNQPLLAPKARNEKGKKFFLRRKFLLTVLVCLLAGMLCGCTGNGYSKKERAALEKKGRAMMEEYLEKYIPEAEILSAAVQEEYVLGSIWYLTEYVKGEYTAAGETWEYFVNTETGQIYSGKPFARVKTLISEEIRKLLELPEESELLELIVSPVELPHGEGHYGKNTNWYDEIWCHEVLPINMTGREEEYLAMEDRNLIPVELARFCVPDEFSLAEYHLKKFPQGILGLSIGQIKVSNAYGELVLSPEEAKEPQNTPAASGEEEIPSELLLVDLPDGINQNALGVVIRNPGERHAQALPTVTCDVSEGEAYAEELLVCSLYDKTKVIVKSGEVSLSDWEFVGEEAASFPLAMGQYALIRCIVPEGMPAFAVEFETPVGTGTYIVGYDGQGEENKQEYVFSEDSGR